MALGKMELGNLSCNLSEDFKMYSRSKVSKTYNNFSKFSTSSFQKAILSIFVDVPN